MPIYWWNHYTVVGTGSCWSSFFLIRRRRACPDQVLGVSMTWMGTWRCSGVVVGVHGFSEVPSSDSCNYYTRFIFQPVSKEKRKTKSTKWEHNLELCFFCMDFFSPGIWQNAIIITFNNLIIFERWKISTVKWIDFNSIRSTIYW